MAVLRTDGGPAYTLYVEPRNPEIETWTGYRPGTDGAAAEKTLTNWARSHRAVVSS
mgnify:CR=1 FL=1